MYAVAERTVMLTPAESIVTDYFEEALGIGASLDRAVATAVLNGWERDGIVCEAGFLAWLYGNDLTVLTLHKTAVKHVWPLTMVAMTGDVAKCGFIAPLRYQHRVTDDREVLLCPECEQMQRLSL